ncbi:hypothetical protein HQ865_03235 [Mucilaginibacter mali]|uniref:Sensor of ECF-type sigma factor n=1 Tax=Mucilaginibacter mali TaxID=2740462 RepID=A0A7D4QDF3_9SPHI|nr:hypothetical protein [Mucilaginibacter mali]QKJ28812.1 hypothetical protein HQ865_03235 [Mucilaginibacter mali]
MDKLLKHTYIILLTLGIGLTAFAQGGRPPALRNNNAQTKVRKPTVAKRFEVIKKAYIAQRLALTQEQSAKFWPTYDEYQYELDVVADLRKANNAQPENGTDQFERELGYQQRITNLQKHYYEEFIKMIPPEKANLVFKSERDFKFELLRRLKEGRQQPF